jgi:hypothetical protein
MAGHASTLDVPVHANLVFMAQRDRGLLRHPHQAAIEAWRVPIRRRPSSRNQPLEHNAEPKPFTWTADPDKIIAAVRRRGTKCH